MGICKDNPEALINHIERYLSSTDRSLDEIHQGKLGFIEQKLIPGFHRNQLKGFEGVGRRLRFIRR